MGRSTAAEMFTGRARRGGRAMSPIPPWGDRTARRIVMMRDRLRASGMVVAAGAMVLLGGVSLAGAGKEALAKRGVAAKAAFAKLKKLAGTWTVEYEATGKAADFQKKL